MISKIRDNGTACAFTDFLAAHNILLTFVVYTTLQNYGADIHAPPVFCM